MSTAWVEKWFVFLLVVCLGAVLPVEARPRIRIGYGVSRPMTFQDSTGKAQGFAVEAIEAAARITGFDIEWIPTGPPPVDNYLRNGTIDMLVTGVPSPQRRAAFFVSEPWWRTEMVAIAPTSSRLSRETQLNGRRLAVPISGVAIVHETFPDSPVIERGSARDVAAAACSGDADFGVIAEVFLREILFQIPDSCHGVNLRTVELRQTLDYAIVSRRDKAPEAEALRQALDRITIDGTLIALAEKHPPVSTRQAVRLSDLIRRQYERHIWTASAIVGSALLLLALLFTLWLFRSRRRLLAANAELRRAETALQESEHRFRNLVETTFDWIWEVDAEARYIYASPKVRDLLGYSPEEVLGRTPFDFMPPDERQRVRAAYEESVRARAPFVALENTNITKDGRRVVLETSGVPVLDESGALRGYRGMDRDITERKRVREEIRRIVANSPALLYLLKVRPDGFEVSWVSESIESLTGYGVAAVMHSAWWVEHIHPDDRPAVLAATPLPYEVDHQVLQFRVRHKDGHYIRVRDEKRLLRDENGEPSEVIGCWSDITRLAELEDQLRQSQKMEAVGTLAGGVAHDFNNLLTVINGYATLLLPKSLADESLHFALEQILQAGEHAADLIRRLLAFSRKQVLQPKLLGLNEVVTGLAHMLRRLVGEDIIVEVSATASPDAVVADRSQLEQVLLNLVVNARDAMPGGGRVSIRTFRAGPDLVLEISDTGVGMDEATRLRIFEPFFTTKEHDRGTGLGLAMVQGIVAQSGGRMEVTSTPGAGSTFRVILPAAGGAASPIAVAAPPPPPAAGELVLIVEDQADVRTYAARALSSAGYRVSTAGNAQEALEIYRSNPQGISVVLCDIVMPGVSGIEFHNRLLAEHPSALVVFMSGYPEPVIQAKGALPAGATVVPKPFTPEQIAAAIRSALHPPIAGGRVLVADRDLAVSGLLCLALDHAGFAASPCLAADRLLDLAISLPADVVILDMLLPGLSAPETLALLRKARPGAAVLALSADFQSPDWDAIPDCQMLKPIDPRALVDQTARLLRHQ